MREFKAAEVVTSDGYVLKLHREPLAASSPELAMSGPPTGTASPADDDDDELEDEEHREKRLKAEWTEHWQRLTLSSGAGVPTYPGADRASRFLAGRP